MDALHLNVNKPVFCCPSGALESAQPRSDPFREFEHLFLSGQIGSQPSSNCTCRSLFSRCELHNRSSSSSSTSNNTNRFSSVFRKFTWLPGAKHRSSTNQSNVNNRQSIGLRNKMNGKPIITVMHDTVVKNNVPLTSSSSSNDHKPSNSSKESIPHTCTANGLLRSSDLMSPSSTTNSIHSDTIESKHRCHFDFKLPTYCSNSYQDETLTRSNRIKHRKQIKSESYHLLASESRISSDIGHQVDLSFPSSCSSFALSTSTSIPADPASCDAFHSLPIENSISTIEPQTRSRSQNDHPSVLSAFYGRTALTNTSALPSASASTFHSNRSGDHMPELRLPATRSNGESSVNRSKSPAVDSLDSNHYDPTNASSSDHLHKSRLPSYVGISCAISGYSSFNRYFSSSSSSSFCSSSHHDTGKPLLITCSYNDRFRTSNRTSTPKQMAVDTESSASQQANNTIPSINLLLDLSIDSDQSVALQDKRVPDNDADDDEPKSLVQSRIESLYGSQFANVWRTNREKVKPDKNDQEAFRSPSCPPDILTNLACNKNLPVFRHIVNATNALSLDNVDSISNAASSNQPVEAEIKLNDCLIDSRSSNSIESDESDENVNTLKRNSIRSKSTDINKNEIQIKFESKSDSLKASSKQQVNDQSDEQQHDGYWFLQLHRNTCEQIRKRIEQAERFNIPDSLMNLDEVGGRIRLAIGKANLLIDQKLKQFKELCDTNLNQKEDEQFSTRCQDLQGFWEMVSIQVDDIHRTFDELDRAADNNWKFEETKSPVAQKPINSTRKGLKSKSIGVCNKAKSSTDSKSSHQKDEERRNRLKEAKRKQMEAFKKAQLIDTNIEIENNHLIVLMETKKPIDTIEN